MAGKKRFILSQGHFDSACFLYSLGNAVQCLSGKRLSSPAWRRLVSCVYDPRDFLTSDKGTTRIDSCPYLIAELAGQYLKALDTNGNYDVRLIDDDSYKNIAALLRKNTVLILCDEKHWFCLIDSHDDNAYISCSAILNESNEYNEQYSKKLKRIYNKEVSISDLTSQSTLTCAILVKLISEKRSDAIRKC